MFTGEKPEVSHLNIFGCPMYLHVPKEKISKLDPSGKKGVFVGYVVTDIYLMTWGPRVINILGFGLQE